MIARKDYIQKSNFEYLKKICHSFNFKHNQNAYRTVSYNRPQSDKILEHSWPDVYYTNEPNNKYERTQQTTIIDLKFLK